MPRVKVKGVANPMDFPDDMDIEDIKAFLQKRFANMATTGQSTVDVDPIQATAQASNLSLVDKAAQGVGNALTSSGLVSDNFGAQQIGRNITSAGEFLPVLGDAAAGDEFGKALAGGDGVGMALSALGAIPLVGDAAKKGVKVFHGTPTKFDRPNLEHYASGEGGEGFGYGFHTTESTRTADNYATESPLIEIDGLEYWGNQPENAIAKSILDDGYDKTLANAESVISSKGKTPYLTKRLDLIKSLKDANIVDKREKGIVKEFLIDDNDLSYFIDFDKEIGDQSDGVLSALSEAGISRQNNMSGEDFYYEIAEDYGGGTDGDKEASEFLDSLGIKGIKYKDKMQEQFMGDAGSYSNYTIFNPDNLKDTSK
jgi:hypothetical protein